MAINPNLLIAAPMLQDYFVDKDTGMPLVYGIITLWEDEARYVNYKNWYYQTGSPGAYTFVALDNPLHLSSVGTIQDPNGNDIIPFYYPFQENNENEPQAYFITVYSADEDGNPDILQFTRENFPYKPTSGSTGSISPSLRNYIINNVYWRNIGSVDCTNVIDKIIAPSQHDGYTNGDIRFIKNVTGATDSLSFLPMGSNVLENDITPEYYLHFQCSNVQAGETVKCIQYPVSLHVDTLQNIDFSFVFHAQNIGGANGYLDIYVYQFAGTGAVSQPDPILIRRVTLNSSFQKYIIPFTFPSSDGLTLGEGGDDALFIRVQYPLSVLFSINHTKPQLYLSETIPDNDFDTYDEIESIINSPRTGDYRTSLNTFQSFGFVPANDGSIGSSSSSATARANTDTWPLYSLIWNGILDNWAPVVGGRGISAYADFSANKRLTLTRNLGRVLAGLNPVFDISSTFTVNTGTDILTLATATNVTLTIGTPVQVYNSGGGLPSPLTSNTIYFVTGTPTTTTFQLATTIENAYAGTFINITTAGTGTQTITNALGAYFGESNHVLTVAELAAHHHAPSNGGSFVTDQAPAPNVPAGTLGTAQVVANTGDTGGNQAHNTIQPTTYVNVFIKL